jgi:hypothetical protein
MRTEVMEFELVVFVVQGRRDEGIKWYKQAAELRHPAGMCNLGLAYLQGYLLFFTPQLRWVSIVAEDFIIRQRFSYIRPSVSCTDFSRPEEKLKWIEIEIKTGRAGDAYLQGYFLFTLKPGWVPIALEDCFLKHKCSSYNKKFFRFLDQIIAGQSKRWSGSK